MGPSRPASRAKSLQGSPYLSGRASQGFDDFSQTCPVHGAVHGVGSSSSSSIRRAIGAASNSPSRCSGPNLSGGCRRSNCVACMAKREKEQNAASMAATRRSKKVSKSPVGQTNRDDLEARVRELEEQVERDRLEKKRMMEAFEGGGNVKDALKDLDAARRRAAENQEQAKSAIRDLTEKNQWLEAGFAEERSKAEASAEALEASREETMRLKQRIGELEGELRGLKEVGGGDRELRERMRELEAELKVMRENADEELQSRLKEADANLLLVEEAQKRIAALEEEKRSREREVQSLQERLREGENTVKDLEAGATSRQATEEGRRALMMKKEELERSLASSEEEAAAVRRALAAAERRGNDLSRKLREAEEREAAMHSEQRLAVMTEGKQKELLDMVSAAEAEAKSARLKVAAAERARVKEKQEADERFSRLEADLVSRHESARRVDKETMLRMEAEAERLRAEGGAEVRAKLKRAEDEVEGLKEQVRSMRADIEKRSEEARRERQQRLEAETKPGTVDIIDLERRLAAAEKDAAAADKEVEAGREKQLRAAQVVREGRVRLDQALVRLEHSSRTCKSLRQDLVAANKRNKVSRDEIDYLEKVLVHATEIMARKGGGGGVKHVRGGYWAEQSRKIGEMMAEGVYDAEGGDEGSVGGEGEVEELLERERMMKTRETAVLDELMAGAGYRGTVRGATVRDAAESWLGGGSVGYRGTMGIPTVRDASDDWIGLGGDVIGE